MIAIKHSEAAILEALTQRTVLSLPYWDRGRTKRAWFRTIPRFTIITGPFASGYVGLYNIPVEVLIAGNI